MSRTVWIALGVLFAVAAVILVLSTTGGGGDSAGPAPLIHPAAHPRDGGYRPHKDRIGLPRPTVPE